MSILDKITLKLVPNYTPGRTEKPTLIVIHITEGLRDSVYQTFLTEPKSTHFMVNKDGSIWQFVRSKDTAWGNGVVDQPTSSIVLEKKGNPNNYSVSIEHEGYSTTDITPEQYDSSYKLVKYLADYWKIPLDRTHIIRHEEITGYKTCPGRISVEKIIRLARK
jgi:N-acetyl-anhydromuramyl-L-alanine amidase AmpD